MRTLAVLLPLVLWPAAASATTVRALAIGEHVQLSHLVIEGRVVAQTVAQSGGHSFVDSTIAVDRALVGNAPRELRVRQLGPDRIVVGDGRLEVGDRVVVFLRRGPNDRFYLTALAQSVYQVLGSGDSAPVARDLDGLSLVRFDAQGNLVAAIPEAPPTLDALRRAIAEAR